MAVLHDLEDRLPVDLWRIGDIAVWPLVRRDVAWSLEDAAVAASPGSPVAVARHRLRAAAASLGAAARKRPSRPRVPAHRSHADVVTLSNTVSQTLIDGVWYDEFFDPIASVLETMGRRVLRLETGRDPRTPHHLPGRSVQWAVDALKVRSLVARPDLASCRLPRYSEFLATMGDLGAVRHFDVASLWRRTRFVDLVARYLAGRIHDAGAVLAMTDTDGPVAMGFHLACHRLGVASVELQHGVQGDLHWGHGAWQRLPPQGYSLLPAVFWTWTEHDAQTIRRWTAPASAAHRVIVGGHPWLRAWRDSGDPVVAHHDERITELLRRTGARVHVLVTLQTGVASPEWLQAVREAAAATPAWFWWLRSRSSMTPDELDGVRVLVRSMHNAETELATRLPLNALLRHVDAHVTAFSSASIEAAEFGVPTVATSRTAMDWFPDLDRQGWLVVATQPAQIVAAIRDQIDRVRSLPRRHETVPPLQDVLRQLLPEPR